MEGEARRESPAIRAGATAAALIGFVVFVGFSVAGLRLFYNTLAGEVSFATPRGFAAPRLIVISDGARDPGIDAQRRDLDSWKWIDRDKGLVQAPIARAMQIVAARGAKAYDPIPAQP